MWHLQTRLGVAWRTSYLRHDTFGAPGRVLTAVGGSLNLGVSGHCSIATAGSPHESLPIQRGRYGVGLGKMLQEARKNFWCDIACCLKAFGVQRLLE